MTGQHLQAREKAASAAQYVLLGGFAAVAAGISAQGLTGFARSNMELRGPWPYLLFLALDGAAGVCAVLVACSTNGASPLPACKKLTAIRPSFSVRICEGTVNPVTSYPSGSTTLLRFTPNGRSKTIVFPSA